MARYELHGIWASGPTYKVGLMLALAGVSYDYVHVDLASGAQRQPEYLSKNRFGVVPCLTDKQTGEHLCQSAAILEHLADAAGKFQGADAAERRQAREWVLWGWDRLARGVYRPRAYKFGFWKASEEVEAHYAIYPPGTRYGRHRDRFRDDDARVLSCVLYLNDAWTHDDGGALRLYDGDGAIDVLPEGGRLVAFLSADFEHEVLPARRERLSIAGWFRRRVLV